MGLVLALMNLCHWAVEINKYEELQQAKLFEEGRKNVQVVYKTKLVFTDFHDLFKNLFPSFPLNSGIVTAAHTHCCPHEILSHEYIHIYILY